MSFNLKNPRFNSSGTIDVEYEHPIYGWIPFTANPNDTEQLGKDIHAAALLMEPAPYLPPSAEVVQAEEKLTLEAKRRTAYQIEADPIFFMAQRGEATIQDWQAKIAEIKARFPYPTA